MNKHMEKLTPEEREHYERWGRKIGWALGCIALGVLFVVWFWLVGRHFML